MNLQTTTSTGVCPVCESFSGPGAWRYREYEILKCGGCGLQFAWPMNSTSVSYYVDHSADIVADARSGNIHPGYLFLIETIREACGRYLSANQRRVIDVGCGPGYLLVDLRDRGFDCLGVDFNPLVVDVAKQCFGLNVQVRTIENLGEMDPGFDLVLLSHVLEHVTDPLALLASIRRIMKPNGIVVIEVPDPEYCRTRAAFYRGSLAWGDYPPHHLTFWSPQALEKVLLRAGFEVLMCKSRPYPEKLQTRYSFVRERGWPDCRGTTFFASALEAIGKLFGLRGSAINAIARTPAVSDGRIN